MRSELEYLLDIQKAADLVIEWTSGMSKADFFDNDLYQSAVLFQLMIVGEAVSWLSDELRKRHPEVEWASIKAFRNIIVHAYFNLSLPIVWASVKVDLPMLREVVQKIVTEDFGDPERDDPDGDN